MKKTNQISNKIIRSLSIYIILSLLVLITSCSPNQPDTSLSDQLNEDLVKARQTIESLTEDMDISQESLEEKKEELSQVLEDLKEKEMVISQHGITIQTLTEDNEVLSEKVTELEDQLSESEEMMVSGPSPGASLLVEASQVLSLMQVGDFAGLAAYVHPTSGLRVSPYQYVNTGSDIVLTAADVSSLTTYPLTNWGTYDGSGEPINLSGIDYFNNFIYDQDFLIAPYVGQNVILSGGNMINNIGSVYPGASFVEFYFDMFNPAYEGMDWESLTLVMENSGGMWYLVGIVHGQWTI